MIVLFKMRSKGKSDTFGKVCICSRLLSVLSLVSLSFYKIKNINKQNCLGSRAIQKLYIFE